MFFSKNVSHSDRLFTCLGNLGRRDKVKIISLSVAQVKAAKASTSVLLLNVIVTGIIVLPLQM